jgi:hypothetical protein
VIAEAGTDTILCDFDTITLGGNPTATGGAGGYKYTWFCNDYRWINMYASDFLNDTTAPNPIYKVQIDHINFHLIIIDKQGESDTDSISVSYDGWISLDCCPYIYPIKKGAKVQLCTDQISRFPPFKYLWTPSKNLSDSSIWNPFATPDSTTLYTVTITDSMGCTMKQGQYVQVLSSIFQDQQEEIIKIFPNPFDQNCLIQINTPDLRKVSLQFFDVNGRMIRQIKPEKSTIEFEKGELQAGVYFLLVKANNEVITYWKLIIQ